MPGKPDDLADPYRTLGLEPGASMAEVKRAYRLLAKAVHPDSAGEAAVPRFLAIHAAYDEIRTGRPQAGARATRTAQTQAARTPAAEPWRADPARARAARERAKRGPARAGTASAGGPSGTTGAGGASGGRASSGTRSASGRRQTRKATMGSTSYDEARDATDATWSGASWYGPSSGEYWIVNPREYADPRKHGPDYLQRARRPLDGEEAATIGEAAVPPPGTSLGTEGPVRPTGKQSAPNAHRDSASGASTWAGATPRDTRDGRSGRWSAASTEAGWAAAGDARRRTDSEPAGSAAAPTWLGGPADDPIRRLGLALVAWPPIGLAAAALIGDATGCAASRAACDGPEPMLPWLAQAVILGLLLLLPPLTRLLAGGAIAVLLALVPATVVLLTLGGAEVPEAAGALVWLLGLSWVAGVGFAVFRPGTRAPRGAGT